LIADDDSTTKALPADLTRLATVWEKIPVAVRQAWLAATEALAKQK
jgi:hypothetical protein